MSDYLTLARSEPNQAPALIEFFRHHGVWAPGVKLFRRMQFRSKALIISTAFVLPLAAMFFFLWQANHAATSTTQSERRGIEYIRPALALVNAAQDRRHAATLGTADLATAQQRVTAAMEQLDKLQAALGAEMGTQEAFAELKKLHAAIDQTPVAATPDATLKAHSEYIDAALALVGVLASNSQLILDPEADTFHMMNMVVVHGPKQTENTALLTTLGTLVLKSADRNPARHDQLVEASAIQRHIDGYVEGAYQAGVAAFPEVAKNFDMQGTDDAFDAFLVAIKKQLMGAALEGTPEAYQASGKVVTDKQNQLNGQVMARLDSQLSARVDRLTAELTMQAVLSVVFVGVALYLFYSFYLVTHGGLREVQKHLEAMTAGDLTTHPNPWGKDEAAGLMGTLADMQGALRAIVGQVRGSSDSIVHASTEIATASMDLSARTEQTAANLEESASSMEEISSTVRQTSENAVQAAELAASNAHVAERGGEVIGQVVSTMQGIHASSNKINEIIGTIDGIAFQTNILALNAAVEAARAGEQGRGFAVVASEVRSLAQRSAQAAKEIKTLIVASVEQVSSGTRVVQGAGVTMQELVGNARRMNTFLADISTAAREQSSGVTQVGTAVQDLDRMTQQNAALVEQTAAAAGALKDQAVDLASRVAKFKLPAHV